MGRIASGVQCFGGPSSTQSPKLEPEGGFQLRFINVCVSVMRCPGAQSRDPVPGALPSLPMAAPWPGQPVPGTPGCAKRDSKLNPCHEQTSPDLSPSLPLSLVK